MTPTEQIVNAAFDIKRLEQALIADVLSHKEDRLHELVAFYAELQRTADAFNAATKTFKELTDRVSREFIPEAMRRENTKTIHVDGVGRATLNTRYSCSMLDQDAAMNWLRENGFEGLIRETVNSQTLSAAAKRMSEDEGREFPDELFKTSMMTYTSLTKA